jgi:hypothetical protein
VVVPRQQEPRLAREQRAVASAQGPTTRVIDDQTGPIIADLAAARTLIGVALIAGSKSM